MNKRTLSLLLALVIVFGLFPVSAWAGELNNGLVYKIYEDHVEITGYTGNDTELVIPDEIDDLPVTSIGKRAFYNRSSLASIALPDSVTTIGDYAFYECASLASVVFGTSLTSIGGHAFYGCASLASIALPDSVTTIGDYAFYECASLASVVFGTSLTSIGRSSFSDCDSLVSIALPDSVTTIGDYAFDECASLASVEFGASLTSIGRSVFSDCDSLVSIAIPDSVTTIGDYAFYSCTSLASVVFGTSLTSIGRSSFSDCDSLVSIAIPDGVTIISEYAFRDCDSLVSIAIPDSVTTIRDYAFYSCDSLTIINFPESLTFIGKRAFQLCKNLVLILFSGDAPYFDGDVFYDVAATAYFPKGNSTWTEETLQNYGGTIAWESYTYTQCSHKFASVVTAPTCEEEGYTTFTCSVCGDFYVVCKTKALGHNYEPCVNDDGELIYICITCGDRSGDFVQVGIQYTVYNDHVEITGYTGNASRVVIPDKIEGLPVTAIGHSAFARCVRLTSIDIPDSVTSIGGRAFEYCTGLTSIDIPDSVTSIGSRAFEYCTGLTSIDIPDSVTSIGSRAFEYCTGLTSIDIPDSVATIGPYAFSRCNNLTSVNLFDGLTVIEGNAFEYCTGLTSIDIPDSVTSIGGRAFDACSELTSVGLPDGFTRIEVEAFRDCVSLTSIDIPAGITYIEKTAFSGCSNLKGFYVDKDNLEYSSDDRGVIFDKKKTALRQVPDAITGSYTIPDGVTDIGAYAFADCDRLTSVDIPDGVTQIAGYAFIGCSSLTSIDIPDGVNSINMEVFRDCTSLNSIYFNGNAPEIDEDAFENVTATAYYPVDNPTWTEDVKQDYGGTITWGAFGCELKCFDYVAYKDHVEISNYTSHDTEVVIPARIEGLSVTAIGSNAFAQCDSLTSIEIADSVTSIGDGAFSECVSLISIYFNGDAPVFDGGVFSGVDATAYYPSGNTTWTEAVMQDYGGNITWVAYTPCLHENTAVFTAPTCTDQGYTTYTCHICAKSSFVYETKPLGHTYEPVITKEVTTTENGEVLHTCITCGYSYIEIIPSVLRYKICADHVEISGFTGKPTEIVVPAEIEGLPVTVIGDSAFYRCYSLTSISIPDSVTTIGNRAFQDCNFRSISIPDSVTSIGEWAFGGCTYLSSISIPKGMTAIADFTFYNCWDLRSVSIPEGVTSVGEYAFFGCGMTSISIPSSVAYLADSAFEWCFSLKNIDFADGVTVIGNGALSRCAELTSVRFKGDAPELDATAFEKTTTTAYYPASNPTWTDDVMQDYGGTITWVSYEKEKLPFSDVAPETFYYEPVMWAIENGITNGATATTFNPNGICLRAQVVTFLHRADGNPEPTSTRNPFTDVKSGDFFYQPVLWAVEKGITNGTSATTFGSYANCNRAAVVTFLWRAAGSPEPESTNNPFVDVKITDFFYKPVLWAVENGITNGVDATHFGPATDCNRAQVVTFLYRAYN